MPLTAARFPALEELFADGKTCSRCWCMYWRIGSAYRRQSEEENREQLRALVEKGPTPGLIAYVEKTAVGWCQFTPRAELAWLEKRWRSKAPDEQAVWSISCFYIRKNYRGSGVTAALIEAVMAKPRKEKIRVIEAYPLDAERTPSASGTGYVSTFARLGFDIVAGAGSARPVMRYEVKG